MAATSDFRNGMALIIDGELVSIIQFQHVKPGKGGAFVRTKLRRVKDGSVVEKTFRAGEKFTDAFIEKRTLQYLYRGGEALHCMDVSSYEQIEIPVSALGSAGAFLKENMELEGQFHDGQIVGMDPPTFVDLRVASTEPGVRGDTSKAALKPATLETGATIQVPLFVQSGNVVRVDTRTGAYVSRR